MRCRAGGHAGTCPREEKGGGGCANWRNKKRLGRKKIGLTNKARSLEGEEGKGVRCVELSS